jgi:hypothetical protein
VEGCEERVFQEEEKENVRNMVDLIIKNKGISRNNVGTGNTKYIQLS